MTRKLIFDLALVTALASSGLPAAVLAQTPDGLTPAVEEVCSDLNGAAFGLCNAYCEAMDCDFDTPQASEQACERVKNNFTKLTGEENLPCELSDCEQSCAPDQETAVAACILTYDPNVMCGADDSQCEADTLFERQQCILRAEAVFEQCVQLCSGG